MGEVIRFPNKKKEWIGQISLTFHVQTDILDDGSVWYKIGSENLKTKEIIWDGWRKVDETS